MRVLIVEDEERLADLIQRSLSQEGHAADVAHTGADALEWLRVATFDAVILDVMLPDTDGFAICRTMRANGQQTPVLLLTARDALDDRVTGLDAGADDYLVKPFAQAELSARLRALARRPPQTLPPVLEVADLRLDPAARRVWRGADEHTLTNKEFRILELLMRRPDQVLTRAMITEHVWEYGLAPSAPNVIDVHIRALRRKLDESYPIRRIHTVRGLGYQLTSGDA